ncbi:hypothetical protein Pyn_04386 [Prunus yedoensis var. nudiflora]|uniref:Uncharacterized protein n=1 Tax=Prunus yedoensis var. nudiflora TaxID=2094558 RepID=A0A314V3I7_PRUYE|nr:hypothetical protein Pyn_04386 [Prunus yedoensis var. nudiflora]
MDQGGVVFQFVLHIIYFQQDHRSRPRLPRRLEVAAVVEGTLDNRGHIPMTHRSPPDLHCRLTVDMLTNLQFLQIGGFVVCTKHNSKEESGRKQDVDLRQ